MWTAEITEKGFSNGQFYAYVVYSDGNQKFQETYASIAITSETWLKETITSKLTSLENSQTLFDKDLKEGTFDISTIDIATVDIGK